MATYVMLMKFLNPGVESIQGARAGRAAGKKAAKALGITWKQQYLVMGEYDIITILEAPNDEVVAKFALMGMTGSLAITTMRAFTEAEADKLLKELRPPEEPD
ncbi:MAG: GYD domain-containing protein [Acidimicrobiales bacterium]